MNNVVLMGRITRDIEARTVGAKETCMAKFNLAVDRKFNKEEQSADFINCTAFGKTAEIISNHCGKGTKIAVVGRIQTGSYEGKDGRKIYTTDVIVDSFDFCESKGNSSNSSNGFDKSDTNNMSQADQDLVDKLPF